MSKMSFLDKLGILFSVSTNSIIHIILLIILISLGVLFLSTNKKTKKRNKMIYISCSIFLLLFVIITYHGSLASIFDYMMNNLFIAIYFPNLAIYLAALIITNIILWISLFHYKTSEIIKKVNIVVYIIMNYLLFLVLGIINNNNLDVFTQKSVYGNEKASALIELSSIIFILWILFLVFYKIFLIYIKKDYKPKVKKVIIKQREKILPENFMPTTIPEIIYGNIRKTPVKEEIITPINLTDFYNAKESIVIEDKQEDIKPILQEEKIFSNDDQEISEFDRLLFNQKTIEEPVEEAKEVLEPIEESITEIEYNTEEEKDFNEEIVTKQQEEVHEEVIEPIKEDIEENNEIEVKPIIIEPIKETVIEENNTSETDYEEIKEPIIEIPVIEEEKEEEQVTVKDSIEQTLTVEDYKLLLRMLKEQKEKDRQEELRRQERLREQDKFIELQALYGKVR